jgi:Spy/CpxP family protein refolding chaperone
VPVRLPLPAVYLKAIQMKRLLCAIGCALFAVSATPALAQGSPESQASALLAKIQSDKKGLVAKAMNLTDQEAKKFWPLYDKFQRELDGPRREYTRAVLDYVAAEKSMTNANASRLAKQVLAANVNEARILDRYFAELSKVLPGVKAARYMQLEFKMNAVQRFETAKAVPLAE